MEAQRKATEAAPNTAAKVRQEKDISKLEDMCLLQAVCKKPDATTGFTAKHYSADRRLWKRNVPQELSLFDDVPNVGRIMSDLANDSVRDARSGECNIMAIHQKRKEMQNGK